MCTTLGKYVPNGGKVSFKHFFWDRDKDQNVTENWVSIACLTAWKKYSRHPVSWRAEELLKTFKSKNVKIVPERPRSHKIIHEYTNMVKKWWKCAICRPPKRQNLNDECNIEKCDLWLQNHKKSKALSPWSDLAFKAI